MRQKEFLGELRIAIEAIKRAATPTSSEADVVRHFELHTALLMRSLSVEYSPQKESQADRVQTKSKGRIDSRIGNVLVEFKRPSKLKREADIKLAKVQLESYLQTLKPPAERVAVGYLTDGVAILRMEIDAEGVVTSGTLDPLSQQTYLPLLKDLVALHRTRLTASSLVEDFSPSEGPLFALARALFDLLRSEPLGRTQMLFREWQLLFKLAHDDQSKQKAIDARRTGLASALGVGIPKGDNDTEYAALFAVQTAYAVVLKLIASHLLTGIREGENTAAFESLLTEPEDALRSYMARLEAGDIFRDEGFENLLEGDFFSWYADDRQWSESVYLGLKDILRVLARYENTAALKDLGNEAMDLFKDLYMAVIPEKVRHNLGEFYTPPWLADHTLATALQSLPEELRAGAWRAIDPCCGSGTFLTSMIRHVTAETAHMSKRGQLESILGRVVGIDLNPLAVLTARINYFINVAHLIEPTSAFEIPVYLGDSSKIPSREAVDGVPSVQYSIRTLKGDLGISLPMSVVRDTDAFSKAMTLAELQTKLKDADAIEAGIIALCSDHDLTPVTRGLIADFAAMLVELEEQEWNGIWPRIVANFLTTANLGKFDVIVGNPPWIDWKNLPQHYRNSLVEICVDRKLFSGAGRTGGINLNICALITHVAANMWLGSKGVLAFLMPEPLIFQKSYEGFRRFVPTAKDEHQLFLRALVDWTDAGNPFYPVQQPFLTFVIGSEPADYDAGIPVTKFSRPRATRPLRDFGHIPDFAGVREQFIERELLAVRPSAASTAFSYADDADQATLFRSLAGTTEYRGRDGLQLYPEDMYLFSFNGNVREGNHQTASFLSFARSTAARSRRAEQIFETKFMRPVVKGTEIDRFRWTGPAYYAPFPYDVSVAAGRSPLSTKALMSSSPKLLSYFVAQKSRFRDQSTYNSRIVGEKHNTEFYSYTRVGEYSHATTRVAFRHNTKWAATVISVVDTPWSAEVLPVFQSHALSISEGPNGELSPDEAHYVCAWMNAPLVQRYIYQSDDVRSFKVQPLLNIAPYDPDNSAHVRLSSLSKTAHAAAAKAESLDAIDAEIDRTLRGMLES